MESSAVDAHHNPRIGEQDVGLLEISDIFISGMDRQQRLFLGVIPQTTDLEFAILSIRLDDSVWKRRKGFAESVITNYPPTCPATRTFGYKLSDCYSAGIQNLSLNGLYYCGIENIMMHFIEKSCLTRLDQSGRRLLLLFMI